MALQDMSQRAQKMSAAAVIAGIALFFPANTWYKNWHQEINDQRYLQLIHAEKNYAKKSEVTELAQVDIFHGKIVQIDKNLDFLVKSSAVQTVDNIKNELSQHEAQNDGSGRWARQRDDILRRLANAEAYRKCLFDGGENCDASRVW